MEPDIDKIEVYLSGDMTGAEREAFEAEVAADPALAEEVDLVRLAREAVELSISDNLRVQLKEWQKAEAAGTKNEIAKVVKMAPRYTLRRVLAIAAGVLLLLAAGSFWYANDQYGADNMAMGYYDNDLKIIRGNNEQPLTEAAQNIASGKYAAADAYLENVPETDAYYANARYLLGHSYYRQGRNQDAIKVLQQLGNSADINLKEDAEWLIILSYLQMQKMDDPGFKELLVKMVAEPDHSYHSQAVTLDRKMHSFWYKLAN